LSGYPLVSIRPSQRMLRATQPADLFIQAVFYCFFHNKLDFLLINLPENIGLYAIMYAVLCSMALPLP
jgi:hypothetical protein